MVSVKFGSIPLKNGTVSVHLWFCKCYTKKLESTWKWHSLWMNRIQRCRSQQLQTLMDNVTLISCIFVWGLFGQGWAFPHPNPLRFHLFDSFDKTTKKRSPLGTFKRSYKFFWHRFHVPSFSWLRMSVRSTPHHASAGRLWRCSEPLEDVVHNPGYKGMQSKIAQTFPFWTASLWWCYEVWGIQPSSPLRKKSSLDQTCKMSAFWYSLCMKRHKVVGELSELYRLPLKKSNPGPKCSWYSLVLFLTWYLQTM